MHDPRNPYFNYIVPASAGTGKTYQLSQRFLYLTAAGARPESILTLTFTKKAAGEMRERILSSACQLLGNNHHAAHFESTLSNFYHEAQSSNRYLNMRLKPPLSAPLTAARILNSTQLLKVTTIDSVFSAWVRKFPWEANIVPFENSGHLPSLEISADWVLNQLKDQAFSTTMGNLYDHSKFSAFDAPLQVREISNLVTGLLRQKSFLWLLQRESHRSPFLRHNAKAPLEQRSLEDTIKSLEGALKALIVAIPKDRQGELLEALRKGDAQSLISGRILTQAYTVSGQTFRGAKRQSLLTQIDTIESTLSDYWMQRKLNQLNGLGALLVELYTDFIKRWDLLKNQAGCADFDDLAKGSFEIFHNDLAYGARYLINSQVRHLMLDEFQDTSRLQWAIFDHLVHDILAGEGTEESEPHNSGLRPSLFLVGDSKQSIYGFREADPEIMNAIRMPLKETYDVREAPLNHSFRTCQLILDFVNETFLDLISDFPTHSTKHLDGHAVVFDHGSITILPLTQGDDPIQDEATQLAELLDDYLHRNPLKIIDKSSKQLRPITYSDCGILYRASTHAGIYANALQARGIPCKTEEGGGFLSRPEIADLRALLKLFIIPNDRLSLATILKSPLCNLDDALLMQALETTGFDLSSLVPASLRQAIDQGRLMMPHEALALAFESMKIPSAYAVKYQREADHAEAGQAASANVQSFLERVLTWQQQGHASHYQILEHLANLDSVDTEADAQIVNNALSLMTIHKSKGLEFPLVILVGTGEDWSKRDQYWVKGRNALNQEGVYFVGRSEHMPRGHHEFDAIFSAADAQADAENHRLLYVAMTRAQHHLIITGAKPKRVREGSKLFYERLAHAASRLTDHERFEDGLIVCKRSTNLQHHPKIVSSSRSALAKICVNQTFPSEIRTVAPHRVLNASEQPSRIKGQHEFNYTPEDSRAELYEKFPTLWGTLVHQGLEYKLSGRHWDAQQAFCSFMPLSTPHAKEAIGLIQQEVHATTSDLSLLEVLNSYPQRFCEFGVLTLTDSHKTLLRGTIDLYLENFEGCGLIVDFKTSRDSHPDLSTHQLRQLAISKNYTKQLELYKDAILKIRKVQEVKTAVYFTYCQRLVYL